MKPDAFSASINFRNSGTSQWNNLLKLITYKWPASFLLREVMIEAKDYKEAVNILSNSEIIAPCYYIVCGISKGEGIVITRNRNGYDNWNDLSKRHFIFQTNSDNWRDDGNRNLLYSGERIKLIEKELKEMKYPPYQFLWKLMKTEPIRNEETIYGTIMCPRSGFYETKINLPEK